LNELLAIAPPPALRRLDRTRTRNREQRPDETEKIGPGQGDEEARGKWGQSNTIESIEGGGRSPDGLMDGRLERRLIGRVGLPAEGMGGGEREEMVVGGGVGIGELLG